MVKKYFTEENEYKGPILIKFDEPKVIKITELKDFLEYYTPFPCSDVYLYERFEYGDFDNWVDAIIESVSIDPKYSKFIKEDEGVFKAGETYWSIMSKFWNYCESKPFWKEPLQTGYDGNHKHTVFLHEITLTIHGVYIISWEDKRKIELGELYE